MNNKTLIAFSILATGICSVSYANAAEFYGRFDIALTDSDNGFTTQNGKSGTVLENNFSRLGVKGTEQISEHLSILYQFEAQVNGASNEGSTKLFSPRNTYIGMKSRLGTVLVGRNDTVMKTSKGTAEAFALTNAAYNRMIAGQDRKGDGVTYYSPRIANAFDINATYLIDDNYAEYDSLGNRIDINTQQFAISVTAGDKKLKAYDYYAAIAYNTIGGVDAYRGVVQYKIGQLKLGGLYQNSESQTYSQKQGDSYFISAIYHLNGVNIKAEYGNDKAGFGNYFKNSAISKDAYNKATDVDIDSFVIGADYRLSQSTMIYGHYATYDGEYRPLEGSQLIDLEKDNIISLGIRYDF